MPKYLLKCSRSILSLPIFCIDYSPGEMSQNPAAQQKPGSTTSSQADDVKSAEDRITKTKGPLKEAEKRANAAKRDFCYTLERSSIV
ncbi:hypothetical protein DdX_16032 [Ditylenchus destructor]|uniref:Uncharacterized protein n=1 Tax=Ditylenchus destructor TaxID=166010 RepID=A0AAD4MPS3_9BILA|nr:hypothetical protein DdX_16032 [Ditylenchus destructor]